MSFAKADAEKRKKEAETQSEWEKVKPICILIRMENVWCMGYMSHCFVCHRHCMNYTVKFCWISYRYVTDDDFPVLDIRCMRTKCSRFFSICSLFGFDETRPNKARTRERRRWREQERKGSTILNKNPQREWMSETHTESFKSNGTMQTQPNTILICILRQINRTRLAQSCANLIEILEVRLAFVHHRKIGTLHLIKYVAFLAKHFHV